VKSTSFVCIRATLTGLEFKLGNEFLFKRPDKFDFTFIEASLFYSTINRFVKKFVISVLPDTRSITGPGALFH